MTDKDKRDYRQEYDKQQASPKAKKQRAARNSARAKMVKAGRASKGDGKDIAHLDNNTSHGGTKNLSVQSKAKNRSFARDKDAHRK